MDHCNGQVPSHSHPLLNIPIRGAKREGWSSDHPSSPPGPSTPSNDDISLIQALLLKGGGIAWELLLSHLLKFHVFLQRLEISFF